MKWVSYLVGARKVWSIMSKRQTIVRIMRTSHWKYVTRNMMVVLLSYCKKITRWKNSIHHHCPIPASSFINITQECNLKCKGCIAAGYKKDSLSAKTVLDYVKDGIKIGMNSFTFIGGEPLISKHFDSILACARRNKYTNFSFVTNGTLLTSDVIKNLESCPNIVAFVSVDGSCKQHCDRRGEGTYERVVKNLSTLKSKKIPFFIITTVTQINYDHVTEKIYAEWCRKMGAVALVLLPFLSVDWENDIKYRLKPQQMNEMESRIKTLNLCLSDFYIIDAFGNEKKFGGCRAANRSITLNADRCFQPCPAIMISDCKYPDTSILNALKSPLMVNIRAIKSCCPNECIIMKKHQALSNIKIENAHEVVYTSKSAESILSNGF